MRSSLRDLATGWRFLRSLPAFLRSSISQEAAEAEVGRRLARRPTDFLSLVRSAIYARPGSPYHRLFAACGCEYGDLERLVLDQGLEGALGHLYREGIYLTEEEMKGRKAVVRGSTTFDVDPEQLKNPWSREQLVASTGGGRGLGFDLAALRDMIPDYRVGFHASGVGDSILAPWMVPSSGGIATSLILVAALGVPPARWFSPVDPRSLETRYRLATAALSLAGRIAGVGLPKPIHVPIDDPLPIARWLAAVLRSGETPWLGTYPTAAVRLCEAALESGIEIAGARCNVAGEPMTATRLAVVERAGVRCTTVYAATECGPIGYGCLNRGVADEVHLFADLHALVSLGASDRVTGLPRGAVLLSSLRPTARLVLINASMGDSAVCETRSCGCPMERLGFTTHLHTIRSFEKLTGAGMTFRDGEIIGILEDILPARFGGSPADYQLVEEESEDGRPRVTIVVHPAIGELDEAQLVDTFLDEIGRASSAHGLMSAFWREARLVRVLRRPPLATAAGKIHHLRGRPSGGRE